MVSGIKYFKIKQWKITPLLILAHVCFMLGAFFLLRHYGFTHHDPNAGNISIWDAGILARIRESGYCYIPDKQLWNTGMFPLFPYIWRWTTLGAPAISALNYLVMLGAFWWLTKTFPFPPLLQLWLLSIPSMLFFYLPYSEAFFFLSATLIVAGVAKDKPILLSIGIFLAMLSRGTGLFFIPIVILMEWAEDFSFRKEVLIRVARKSFLPVMAVLLGIATIAIIQYRQTGYAFSFFVVQTSGTGKHLHGLNFPLTTWYQCENLWEDGLAAVIGILVSLILLFTIWGPSEKSTNEKPLMWDSKVVRFSMIYLAVQVWYVILNAPIDAGTGCTSIMSLGRYVFCNPFWMIFALAVASRPKSHSSTTVLSLFVIFLVICLMGAKSFFRDNLFWGQFFDPAFAYHLGMLLLVFPLFFANRPKTSNYLLLASYILMVVMQLILFDSFISTIVWVG